MPPGHHGKYVYGFINSAKSTCDVTGTDYRGLIFLAWCFLRSTRPEPNRARGWRRPRRRETAPLGRRDRTQGERRYASITPTSARPGRGICQCREPRFSGLKETAHESPLCSTAWPATPRSRRVGHGCYGIRIGPGATGRCCRNFLGRHRVFWRISPSTESCNECRRQLDRGNRTPYYRLNCLAAVRSRTGLATAPSYLLAPAVSSI